MTREGALRGRHRGEIGRAEETRLPKMPLPQAEEHRVLLASRRINKDSALEQEGRETGGCFSLGLCVCGRLFLSLSYLVYESLWPSLPALSSNKGRTHLAHKHTFPGKRATHRAERESLCSWGYIHASC